MKKRVQSLARQSAFYSLGNVAVKIGGLILAPVLLNPDYLEVASYGYLALLLVSAQLGVFVVGLGISSGLLRFWTHPDFRERRDALAVTSLFVSSCIGILITASVYFAFGEDVAVLLLDDRSLKAIVGLVLLYVLFKVIGAVPLTLFRVQERPLVYGSFQMLEVAFLVALCIYWLVFSNRGLEGVLLSYAAAAGATTLVSCTVAFAPLKWTLDLRVVRPLIRFGAPLSLASLSAWILNSSDRYLLKWLSDPLVIAEYDWASRVAGVINVLLVQSFQLAFLVVGLRRLDADDVSLHREIFRHYVVWTGWALLGLALLSGDAMQLMASVFSIDESYVGISLLVLLVGIGFWAYGANQIVSSVLTGAGKTGVVAFCVGVAALSNIALNIVLIPSLEGVGAAAATAIAFLILTAFSTRFAERLNSVGYDWPLAAMTLVLIVGLFYSATVATEWSVFPRMVFRVSILLSYFPILILTRMYRADELKGGLRTIRSIVSGGSRSAGDAPG